MATQTKFNQNEPKGDIMVMTSPYHTASITAYPEIEESQSVLLIPAEVTTAQVQEEHFTASEDPAEVWAIPRKEALPARIARRVVAFAASGFLYFDWLSAPQMTQRDRVNRDVAKARAELWAHTQIRL